MSQNALYANKETGIPHRQFRTKNAENLRKVTEDSCVIDEIRTDDNVKSD
jgi:hypothetical protein